MKVSKIEQLNAVIKGEKLEYTPHAVWRHFPVDDLYAERLAKKQLAYNEKFDSMVMKVSPNGRYCVTDWGCEIDFDEKKLSGSAFCTSYRVKSMDDWMALEELDVNDGMFGEQLKALDLIREGLKDDTPFVETIFNPLMIAGKLVENREFVKKTMIENPTALKEGLKVITKAMTDFSRISVEKGAIGMFIATQEATYDFLTEEQYKEFGMKYDLEIMNAIKSKAKFNMIHIHGNNIMFDLIAENYPAEALNWHDQLTPPKIAEAFSKFKGVLMGGIEEQQFILNATKEELLNSLKETINSVNNRRLIIAPGCVIPINVPDERVESIVNYLKKRQK